MLKKEMVNHPAHYQSCSLECIDNMIIAFGAEYVSIWCCITSYKYLYRYTGKNGLEDLKKAEWYLNKCWELFIDYEIDLPKQYCELEKILEQHLKKVGEITDGNEKGNE